MKLLGKYNQFGLTVVAMLLFGVLSILVAPKTFAATRTWDGGGSDDNWSTATNWDTDTAPVNGDDIVFTLANSDINSTNDFSNLTVNSITVNGVTDDASDSVNIFITNPLTIAGNVTSSVAGDSTRLTLRGDIVLGSDVTMTNASIFARTGNEANDNLDLNGHTLTYKTDSLYTGLTINIDQSITGSGTFTIDVRNSVSLFLASSVYTPNGNTYSGTTNLITGTLSTSGGHTNKMFGTSTINIGATATLGIETDGTSPYIVSNPINIAAATIGDNGYLDDQLYVWAGALNQVINISNITLNGNARFALNGSDGATVNLAGIQANGFCVQYGDETNFQAARFLNGPNACVIGDSTSSVTNVPGAPNTGEKIQTKTGLIVASVVGVAIVGFVTRYMIVTKKLHK